MEIGYKRHKKRDKDDEYLMCEDNVKGVCRRWVEPIVAYASDRYVF